MAFAWLSLGSNTGDRKKNLFSALSLLRRYSVVVSVSELYETEPVGFKEQPPFLNSCVKIQTALTPEELLDFALGIESRLGRDRRTQIKNGPRPIDIDILFYEDKVVRTSRLQLPHPRLHERRFVLVPLAEIAPEKKHPVLHLTVRELLQNCRDVSSVERFRES